MYSAKYLEKSRISKLLIQNRLKNISLIFTVNITHLQKQNDYDT